MRAEKILAMVGLLFAACSSEAIDVGGSAAGSPSEAASGRAAGGTAASDAGAPAGGRAAGGRTGSGGRDAAVRGGSAGSGVGGRGVEVGGGGGEPSAGLGGEAQAGGEGGAGDIPVATCETGRTHQGSVTLGAQRDVARLAGVEILEGNLQITGDIADLSPLHCLTAVNGTLSIEQTALVDLRGLDHLVWVYDLTISGNKKLVDLNGLKGVTSVTDLRMDSNKGLKTLAGLENLSSINALFLTNNTALEDVSALDGVTGPVAYVYFVESAIVHFSLLNNASSIGQLFLTRHTSAVSIDALNPPQVNELLLDDFPVLVDLAGLGGKANLTWLIIEKCALLMDLHPLASQTNITTLTLLWNHKLPTCEAEWLAETLAVDPDKLLISGTDDNGICQ